MNKKSLSFSFIQYDTVTDLPEPDKELLDRALRAAGNAYAPYSMFRVGAALLLDNKEIITGNNQENVAYPSGLCAERVAIFYAASKYPGMIIKSIAIYAEAKKFTSGKPVTPCGACRQVIAEYEQKQKTKIRIICTDTNNSAYVFNSINDLLPFTFEASGLKKE